VNRKSAPVSKKDNKNQPKTKEKRTWDDKFAEVNSENIQKVDQYILLIKFQKS
jgi:hypothetical protein